MEDTTNATLEFPRLRSILLVDLPRLTNFCFKVKNNQEFEPAIPEHGSTVSFVLFNEKVRHFSGAKFVLLFGNVNISLMTYFEVKHIYMCVGTQYGLLKYGFGTV